MSSLENLPKTNQETKPSISDIENWLVNYLAKLLDVSPQEIDINVPFDRYGLDSSAAISLTGDLEEWLGQEIDPTILYEYPTIKKILGYFDKI